MSRRCGVDACDRERFARGYCRMHYERWKRNGDPEVLKRPGGPCSIDGCEKLRVAQQLCKSHYRRLQKYGDPLAATPPPERTDPAVRFWRKVNRQAGGCWLWLGGVQPTTGYGNFWLDGTVLAHRYSYELARGPIPDGLTIDHLCRVRHCVNPAHLEAVAFKVNNARGDSPSAKNSRKTHCVNGHSYAEHGVLYRQRRYCTACTPTLRRLLDGL